MIEWRRWPAYERDRHTLAVHEAAHLVLGIVTSTWQESYRAVVTDTHAHVAPVAPHPLPTRTLAEALAPVAEPIHPSLQRLALEHAATMLAGYCAEARLHGFAHEITGPPSAITGTPDDCMARVYLRFAWPGERIRPMWRAWRLADDLVSEHWTWVLSVADAMVEDGACDSAQALRLRVSTPGRLPPATPGRTPAAWHPPDTQPLSVARVPPNFATGVPEETRVIGRGGDCLGTMTLDRRGGRLTPTAAPPDATSIPLGRGTGPFLWPPY